MTRKNAVPTAASPTYAVCMTRVMTSPGIAFHTPFAYPTTIVPTCASRTITTHSPMRRCAAASRSEPIPRSSHGTRAIISTWTMSRYAASIPSASPAEVNASPVVPKLRPGVSIQNSASRTTPPTAAAAISTATRTSGRTLLAPRGRRRIGRA